ncbi:MAG: hypothetical protein JW991_00260 [Candidatus Pacebacteria bacterium]|nr:hypothetical protein [Candidatus Paceibacterota bacterium]
MTNKEINVLAPSVGNGRTLYQFSLGGAFKELGPDRQVLTSDVFNLPTEGWIKKLVLEAGYRVLSQMPPSLYKFIRQTLDERPLSLGSDQKRALQACFEGQTVVSVSPVASRILGSAGISHYGVAGDAFVQDSWLSPAVQRLFVPFPNGDLPGIGKNQVRETRGVLLPLPFAEINPQDKLERAAEVGQGNELFRVGFVTHGAGEMNTVWSLLGIRQALKDKRLHAAFFTGQHRHLALALGALCQGFKIPRSQMVNDCIPGTVSIWESYSPRQMAEIKGQVLPYCDLLISPTANETSFMGPGLFRGARNRVEEANGALGQQSGWLRRLEKPPIKVWQEIGGLVIDGVSLSKMTEAFHQNVSLGVSLTVAREILALEG